MTLEESLHSTSKTTEATSLWNSSFVCFQTFQTNELWRFDCRNCFILCQMLRCLMKCPPKPNVQDGSDIAKVIKNITFVQSELCDEWEKSSFQKKILPLGSDEISANNSSGSRTMRLADPHIGFPITHSIEYKKHTSLCANPCVTFIIHWLSAVLPRDRD